MSLQKQDFLIAGPGYLGLRVAKCWQAEGHRVFVITRTRSRATQLSDMNLSPLQLDLGRAPQTFDFPHIDTLLWCVGYQPTADIPRENIWIDGLTWLIRQLPRPLRRLIYVSSTSVYGPGDGSTVDETSALQPATEGGRCCARAEQLLHNACERELSGTELVVLRMAGIYGPDRLLRKVEDLRARKSLPGRAGDWLNLIHVDDAVRMVCHVAAAQVVPSRINVVNSGTLTRGEYYSELSAVVEAPAPEFSDDAPRSRGGNKRIVSCYRDSDAFPEFRFDDIRAGLRNAARHSREL